jgi:hypothetical protein
MVRPREGNDMRLEPVEISIKEPKKEEPKKEDNSWQAIVVVLVALLAILWLGSNGQLGGNGYSGGDGYSPGTSPPYTHHFSHHGCQHCSPGRDHNVTSRGD